MTASKQAKTSSQGRLPCAVTCCTVSILITKMWELFLFRYHVLSQVNFLTNKRHL